MSGLVDPTGMPLERAGELVDGNGAPLGSERTCRACGCTERDACPGGCAWAADDVDICTRCAALADPYLHALAHAYLLAPGSQREQRAITIALRCACLRLGVDLDELLAFVDLLATAQEGAG